MRANFERLTEGPTLRGKPILGGFRRVRPSRSLVGSLPERTTRPSGAYLVSSPLGPGCLAKEVQSPAFPRPHVACFRFWVCTHTLTTRRQGAHSTPRHPKRRLSPPAALSPSSSLGPFARFFPPSRLHTVCVLSILGDEREKEILIENKIIYRERLQKNMGKALRYRQGEPKRSNTSR